MLPTLQIFGQTITMYGLMIILGLFIGITILVLRSKKYGIKPEDALFAALFGCIGLFLGAKVLHLIISIPELIRYRKIIAANPVLLYQLLLSGYIFYGGLIGAFLGIYLYCKKYHISHYQMLDLTTPSLPIIHSFGRIGCFFAGCCYGIPYQGPGHIMFEQSFAAPNHVALFPVQLLESGINLLAGILLLIYGKTPRKLGQIFGLYITYYALFRFLIEYLRGDLNRGFFLGFSTSQWISLLLLPMGLLLLLKSKISKHSPVT